MTGKVDCQRGLAHTDDDGVPGVRVLSAPVQKDNPWGTLKRGIALAQSADSAVRRARLDPLHIGQRTRNTGLLDVLGQQ